MSPELQAVSLGMSTSEHSRIQKVWVQGATRVSEPDRLRFGRERVINKSKEELAQIETWLKLERARARSLEFG